MLPVALALASAALFGAMTVALRIALVRIPGAEAAAAATVLAGLSVCLLAAAVEGARGDLDLSGAWAFALAGILAPGGSQILFTLRSATPAPRERRSPSAPRPSSRSRSR